MKECVRKFVLMFLLLLLFVEMGIGKEYFVSVIYDFLYCVDGLFVAVNCGALGGDLLESELFGYVFGVFIGVCFEGVFGKIEVVCGGMLFLDEVVEMFLNC